MDSQLLQDALDRTCQGDVYTGGLIRMLLKAESLGLQGTPESEATYGSRYDEILAEGWGDKYRGQRLTTPQYEKIIKELLAHLEDSDGPVNSVVWAIDGSNEKRAVSNLIALVDKYANSMQISEGQQSAIHNSLNFLRKMREQSPHYQEIQHTLTLAASSANTEVREWAQDLLAQ